MLSIYRTFTTTTPFIRLPAKTGCVIGLLNFSAYCFINENSQPYLGKVNLWVLQINRQGDILWEKMASGSGSDYLNDMIVTRNGGVLLLGFTSSYDGDVNDHYGSWDSWLIEFDNNGQKRWTKSFGGTGIDAVNTVILTSDGGLMLVGATDGYGGGNYDTTCNHHNPESGFMDAWLIKLDTLRQIEWQQCYGGTYDESATNILELPDGYIVLGHTMSNDGDVSGYHSIPGPNSPYGGDIWVFKIDKTGNLLWQNCLGGSYDDFARNIFTTSDGGFMIVGTTRSMDGDVVGNHDYQEGYAGDIWFAKIDSTGNLPWQYCYGGLNQEYLYRGIIQKNDWDYVMAIGTKSADWPCWSGAYPNVRVVELYDSTLSAVNEKYIPHLKIRPYPNPAANIVNFHFVLPENSTTGLLEIYDGCGKKVNTIRVNKYGSKKLDCSGMPSGIYFYRLKTKTSAANGKFIIRH